MSAEIVRIRPATEADLGASCLGCGRQFTVGQQLGQLAGGALVDSRKCARLVEARDLDQDWGAQLAADAAWRP